METLGIATSLVSIVLAVLAIVGSLYFYRESKGAEENIAIALEGIKAQTAALERLHATVLNDLVKHATRPQPESTQMLEEVIKGALKLRDVQEPGATEGEVQHLLRIHGELLYSTVELNALLQWARTRSEVSKSLKAKMEHHLKTTRDQFWKLLEEMKNRFPPDSLKKNEGYQYALKMKEKIRT